MLINALGVWLLSGIFGKKNASTHVALCGNISVPVRVTDLVEASKDAASLLVCTRKKIFAWGLRVFCEWRHKWRTSFWMHTCSCIRIC